MSQRFARARDRMTEGAARAGFAVLERPRPISCASTSRRGIEARRREALRWPPSSRQALRWSLCPHSPSRTRRGTSSGCASARRTRRSTPASSPWPGQRSCSHEPGRRSLRPAREIRDRIRRRPGQPLADRRRRDRPGGGRRAGRGLRSGRRGLPRWRSVPAPRRGELVRLLGEELRAAKEPLARLVTIECGKIHAGKPRRGPGDDRHLRFRGRAVAPALWPDHRQRARRPPDDGAMASARTGGGDQRFQFPGRGLGVERCARIGVRRSGDLEAEREDSAVRRSGDGIDAPRPTQLRRGARRTGSARPGEPRDW